MKKTNGFENDFSLTDKVLIHKILNGKTIDDFKIIQKELINQITPIKNPIYDDTKYGN